LRQLREGMQERKLVGAVATIAELERRREHAVNAAGELPRTPSATSPPLPVVGPAGSCRWAGAGGRSMAGSRAGRPLR
jgi:hypothetical protein